jgi:AcrR family transcriptional regulator
LGIKERKLRSFNERRALILKAAQELFAKNGLEHVTLLDIAKEIEFSKGTLYSHFGSKEEIYAQILLSHLNDLFLELKSVAQKSSGTINGIRNSLSTYTNFYKNNKEYFKLLFFFDLMSDHYKIPQKLLKEIQAVKLSCLVQLQNIIKADSSNKGLYREITFVLWGMLNGIIHLIESRQLKAIDLDRLTEVGFKIVINGITDLNKSIK